MKIRLTILAVFCLLFACTGVAAQADVLSSVPADAYGFVAVKSPQGIVDRVKQLLPVLEDLDEDFKDPFAPLRRILGDVDFDGPAAVVLLDCQKFAESEMPIAFLISAADPDAVLQIHKDEVGTMEGELPEGVVAVATQNKRVEYIYVAMKGDFVVVAFEPDMAAALANAQGSFEVLPEVRQAYEQGKIVALGDIQRAKGWLTQMLDEQRAKITAQAAQLSAAPSAEQLKRDIGLLYLDVVRDLLKQLDKFIYILEVSDKGIFYSQKVIFQSDSPPAELINALIGQPEPSYKSIPSGVFILAGALRIPPTQIDVITDALLAKAATYPSLAEELNEESAQKLISDIKATYRQFAGLAFTAGMGSPATGMLNLVVRFDVADAGAFKGQIKEGCQSEFVSKLTEDTGVQLIYTDAAESYAGVGIDTIAVRLANAGQDNPPANEAMQIVQRVLPMVLGPDMSIRIAAPTDTQVLVIIGGGFERAERVINVANGHGSSLADYPKMAKAQATMPRNRIAEIHLDFGSIFGMIKSFAGPMPTDYEYPDLADVPPVSMTYSLEANSYRQDLLILAETIKDVSTVVSALAPPVSRARGQANAAVCATRMKGLDTALYLYANSHNDKYPDAAQWREVLIEEDYTPGELFICPSVGGDPDKDNDYVFVPWPGPGGVEGNWLVIFERNANHDGRRNVVNGAHAVINVGEAEFQEMLAKTIEALKAQGIEFNWQE